VIHHISTTSSFFTLKLDCLTIFTRIDNDTKSAKTTDARTIAVSSGCLYPAQKIDIESVWGVAIFRCSLIPSGMGIGKSESVFPVGSLSIIQEQSLYG
jgi:hypothetical protein